MSRKIEFYDYSPVISLEYEQPKDFVRLQEVLKELRELALKYEIAIMLDGKTLNGN